MLYAKLEAMVSLLFSKPIMGKFKFYESVLGKNLWREAFGRLETTRDP